MPSHFGRIQLLTIKLMHQRHPKLSSETDLPWIFFFITALWNIRKQRCFVREFPALLWSARALFFPSSPPSCSSSQTVVVETEVSSRGLLALFDTVLLKDFFLFFPFFLEMLPTLCQPSQKLTSGWSGQIHSILVSNWLRGRALVFGWRGVKPRPRVFQSCNALVLRVRLARCKVSMLECTK